MPISYNTGQELDTASGTRTTSGLGNAILPAPAAHERYTICVLQIQNESDAAVTTLLKSGNTVLHRLLMSEKDKGILLSIAQGFKWVAGWGEAIFLDLSAVATVNYTVLYFVEYK